MRILIVDAFDQCVLGRKDFRFFVKTVRRAFASADPEGSAAHFAVASLHDLDDYVYEDREDPNNLTKIKRFDRLDYVFIAGNPDILPWSPQAKQLFILMRMCYITNKCVFGTEVAAQIFAFLCATKGYKQVNIINGPQGGDISVLAERNDLCYEVLDAEKDMFLDASSGDLFQYDKAKLCWIPFANSGLTLLRTKREDVLRTFYCRDQRDRLYLNRTYSKKCVVERSQVRHWAIRKLHQHAFVVKCPSRWGLNAAANARSPEKYLILAKTKDVPRIIARKNCLFLCFDVTVKCPESTRLINEYVLRTCKRHRQQGYFSTSANLYVTLETLPTNTNIKTKQSSTQRSWTQKARETDESALMKTFEHHLSNNSCLRRAKSCTLMKTRPRPMSAKASKKNKLFQHLEKKQRRPRSACIGKSSVEKSRPTSTSSLVLSSRDMKVGWMVDRVGFISSLNDDTTPARRVLQKPTDEAVEYYKRKHLASTHHLKVLSS